VTSLIAKTDPADLFHLFQQIVSAWPVLKPGRSEHDYPGGEVAEEPAPGSLPE
jgi:hypothetical protein